MAGAGAAVMLTEAVTAIAAFGCGTLRCLAGFAMGRSVHRIAVLVGIAAVLHQLAFVRLIATWRRGFGEQRLAGKGGE